MESNLIKEFNEVMENKKEEKPKEEKTGLNNYDKPNINISKERKPIFNIISNNEIKEKPTQRPNEPLSQKGTSTQTEFNPLFLEENKEENIINEPKCTLDKNKIENSQKNNLIILIPKITEKKYISKKTKNNTPQNIKKPSTKNNQYNKSILLPEENKNKYTKINKENTKSIQTNVNKDIFNFSGSNTGNIINIHESPFVNNSIDETNNNNNPNFNFKFNDIKKLEKIGLFNSVEEDNLSLLNIHDIHDYKDLYNLFNYHDFHEKQRLFQNNLNNFYGY